MKTFGFNNWIRPFASEQNLSAGDAGNTPLSLFFHRDSANSFNDGSESHRRNIKIEGFVRPKDFVHNFYSSVNKISSSVFAMFGPWKNISRHLASIFANL